MYIRMDERERDREVCYIRMVGREIERCVY